MKRICFIALAICLGYIYAIAYDFKSNGIYYSITSKSTVSVTNSSSETGGDYKGKIAIPATVTYENINYSVTGIGRSAFANCPNLVSVILPDNIDRIGAKAFEGCFVLSSIIIPNNVTSIEANTFSNCKNLISVTMGNNIVAIGAGAFNYCTSLPTITIPHSVSTIGGSAFYHCESLKSIVIPNSVTSIGAEAFSECHSLSSVSLGNGITRIEEQTFYTCYNLNSIIIPDCVNYIGAYAFRWDNLTSVSLPNSVEFIDDGAFSRSSTLKSLTIPQSVKKIGIDCFGDGTMLDTLIVKTQQPPTCEGEVGSSHYVYIPCGTIEAYSSISWGGISSFIEGSYTVSVIPSDINMGEYKNYIFCSEGTIEAFPKYGYHFVRWKDGNTDNPRLVTVAADTTFTAEFAADPFLTATASNDNWGTVWGGGQFQPNTSITISAHPNLGYHFTQWSDGNTDNPREIVLTCDTTFTAEFAQTFSGQCGENLYWKYEGHTLTISGTGNMYDYNENDMPWLLFRDTTDVVILERGITGIGNNAFNGFVKVGKIELPSTLTSIGANAFAGCRKLYDIYSYAVEPPVAENTSFANYNVYLHVPCDNLRDYQMDAVFGTFKYIQCIGAENTTTDGTVTVTPSDNEAVFVWRADESAATYNLEIRKDGEVFCTLIFNANGQLTSIAFAPARNGQTHRAAEQTAAGFRFTVTGLSESTRYTFGMTVKDATNATLQTYTGEFNTTGVATYVDNATTDTAAQKIIRDGQVFILRGDKTYTTMGVEVNL